MSPLLLLPPTPASCASAAFVTATFYATRLRTGCAPACCVRRIMAVSATVGDGSDAMREPPPTIASLPTMAGPGANNHVAASPWQPHRIAGVPASGPGDDWIAPVLAQLDDACAFRPNGAVITHPPRVLVLHGTLRERGFSKALAYECARLLDGFGAEVRIFDPAGLPVRDPEISSHDKVVELRALVEWSEAHVWCASELHGNLCSVFKNQIDWIPLNTGSVRPTQGKAVAVLQVNGGSQSFNVVNTLRLLARWMRMPCVVNQSSVAKAWTEFDEHTRMKPSSLRERVVDVIEEFIKLVRINREYATVLNDRYSERKEKAEKGRLLTQAEKEAEKKVLEEKARKNN